MEHNKDDILKKINEVKVSITRDEKLLMKMNDPHFELLESQIQEQRDYLAKLIKDINLIDSWQFYYFVLKYVHKLIRE